MSTHTIELNERPASPRRIAIPIRALSDNEATDSPGSASARWFYGWLMLPLAIAMMLATSPGQTYGVSYFNERFIAEFGLSNTTLSTTYMVATLLAAASLTFIGALIDRHGTRRMAVIGFVALTGGCVFASRSNGLVTLFLSFLMLRTFGPGTMTLLANHTLAAWFDRRLGLATSIAQTVMAAAFALIPAGIVLLIGEVGWRGTYLVFAGIFGLGFLPLVAIFLRSSPCEVGQVPDGVRYQATSRQRTPTSESEFTLAEAMHQQAYWILLISTAMWSLIGTGLVFHLVGVFQEQDFDARDSTAAVIAVAWTMGLTQVIGGMLADRLAMRWLLMTAMSLIAVACVVVPYATNLETLVFGYGIYGCGQGIKTVIAGTAWARYFGRAHLGKIRGTSLSAAVGASAVGPVVMGVSADYLGGFAPALWLFAGIALACAAASYWAIPPIAREAVAPQIFELADAA